MIVTLPTIREQIRIEGATFDFDDGYSAVEYRNQKVLEALMAAVHSVIGQSTDNVEAQRNGLMLDLAIKILYSVQLSCRTPMLIQQLTRKEGQP